MKRITISVVTLAMIFGLTGCGGRGTGGGAMQTDAEMVQASNKRVRKQGNRIILRCESLLTRNGKPCQNPVREDSWCNRHRALEESRAKDTVRELEAGNHIRSEAAAENSW